MTQQQATNWWGMILGWNWRDGMARMRVTGVVPTPLIVSCISWDLLVNYYYPTWGTGGIQSGPKWKYCLLSHPNSASCRPAHWPTVTSTSDLSAIGKMTLPFQLSLDDNDKQVAYPTSNGAMNRMRSERADWSRPGRSWPILHVFVSCWIRLVTWGSEQEEAEWEGVGVNKQNLLGASPLVPLVG